MMNSSFLFEYDINHKWESKLKVTFFSRITSERILLSSYRDNFSIKKG